MILILAIFPLLASAANDWTKACFQGICSYDVAETPNSMPGSMTITGTSNAISDITGAAGWEIMDCDPNSEAQDIRLVCKSADTNAAGCDHLYQNGAENTIVRLPENCLKVPFARVDRAWIPEDQSVPASVAKRIIKRADGSTPQVKALSLDTNFAAATGKQDSNVTLAIQGSSIPGQQGNATVTAAQAARRSRINERRGFLDFIHQAIDGFKKLDSFSQNVSTTLPPIDVNKNFPVFNASVQCGPASAKIDINANAKAHAQVTLGVVAAGTLVPPSITQFATYTGLTASMDGKLNIVADAAGTLDSGAVTLFQVGLPGLNFPGILSVGPEFKLNAQTKATLDVNVNMAVDLSYDVNKLQLFFPPLNGEVSNGAINPRNAPLQLAVSPGVASKGTLEAHIIPTVDIGLSALGNLASATIFLNLDSNAIMTLSLNAGSNATINTNGKATAGAGVDGCVDVSGGVSANAGAQGKFLNLFDDTTSVPIFQKNFELFKKCFGVSTATSTTFGSNSTAKATSSVLTGIPKATSATLAKGLPGSNASTAIPLKAVSKTTSALTTKSIASATASAKPTAKQPAPPSNPVSVATVKANTAAPQAKPTVAIGKPATNTKATKAVPTPVKATSSKVEAKKPLKRAIACPPTGAKVPVSLV
ncbi:hypothetical protein BD410DRAFT_771726 [Rickenella mellea]|uniref:DUF7223 domain-containing protein n=1 Tax=Rickenella mellea TaxID=50990 RepID=A0A4Y7Q0R8_9AGAM|nr:hypothetical protein BD410DRAFT_771726 [Rickenella mellea]